MATRAAAAEPSPSAAAGPGHCSASDAHQLAYDLPGTAGVRVTCDIAYKSIAGTDLTFDLYLPPDPSDEPLPVVVLFHGNEEIQPLEPVANRWKTDMYRHGLVVAASGWAAIAFDMRGYRVANEPSVIDTQADAVDLIAHLGGNGGDIGIDSSRMCLWSSSGGGIPAAWSALVAEPRPRCAVIFSGRPDASDLGDSSPLGRLDDVAPVPFFVAYGAGDGYARFGSEDFIDALEEAGWPVIVREHPRGHGFEQRDDAEATAIIADALAFIAEHLVD